MASLGDFLGHFVLGGLQGAQQKQESRQKLMNDLALLSAEYGYKRELLPLEHKLKLDDLVQEFLSKRKLDVAFPTVAEEVAQKEEARAEAEAPRKAALEDITAAKTYQGLQPKVGGFLGFGQAPPPLPPQYQAAVERGMAVLSGGKRKVRVRLPASDPKYPGRSALIDEDKVEKARGLGYTIEGQ